MVCQYNKFPHHLDFYFLSAPHTWSNNISSSFLKCNDYSVRHLIELKSSEAFAGHFVIVHAELVQHILHFLKVPPYQWLFIPGVCGIPGISLVSWSAVSASTLVASSGLLSHDSAGNGCGSDAVLSLEFLFISTSSKNETMLWCMPTGQFLKIPYKNDMLTPQFLKCY